MPSDQLVDAEPFTDLDPRIVDPQGWDVYWTGKKRRSLAVYDVVAAAYRNLVIRPQLNRVLRRHFRPGARLLHAGCGSSQVDRDVRGTMEITAVDVSPAALTLYRKNNPRAQVRHASIFDLPFAAATFDGVYNLGVMEHFSREEIARILAELGRVLTPEGRAVFLWPHARASSVFVLALAGRILERLFRRGVEFHPPELTRVRSRAMIAALLRESGFELVDYRFGPRDLFVQAVIVARKAE